MAEKMKVMTLERLTQYDSLAVARMQSAIAASEAKAIKTVVLNGNKLEFYKTEEPLAEGAVPVYSLELPEADLSGLISKMANATAGNLVTATADGQVQDSGIAASAVAIKFEVEAAQATMQSAIDQTSAKVTTLIGEDANKSVRAIAAEELAAQLVAENAKESLDTLEEIAAWIQSHPDDASAMNKLIEDLTALVGELPEGVTATTVVGYIDEVKTALAAQITSGDEATLAAAKEDATTKAGQALTDAKAYTDQEISGVEQRLDEDEADILALQQSLAEGGATANAIKEAKELAGSAKSVADAATATANTNKEDITTLKGRVETLEQSGYDDTAVKADIAKNAEAITALQGEDTTIKASISTLEGNLAKTDANVTGVTERVTTAENKITTLEGEMDAVEGRLDTAEGKITTNEGNIASQGERITALEEKVGEGFQAITSEEVAALFQNA